MSISLAKDTSSPIKSRYWNQALYLLGTALFADGSPSKNKLEVFLDVAIELKSVIEPTVKFRRQTLRAWYDIKAQDLQNLNIAEDDDLLESLLKNISPHGYKVDILTGLVEIFIADGSYSRTAQSLIKRTVLLWNIPEKHIDDIIYVCADLMHSPLAAADLETVH